LDAPLVPVVPEVELHAAAPSKRVVASPKTPAVLTIRFIIGNSPLSAWSRTACANPRHRFV
jgi:hypothetical protein